jgi:hypothetical protein
MRFTASYPGYPCWSDWLKDWVPTWLSVPVPLAVSVALWKGQRWAWWLGLLFGFVSLHWLFGDPDFARRFVRMDTVFLREPLGFLLAMILAFLLPGAQSGCRASTLGADDEAGMAQSAEPRRLP